MSPTQQAPGPAKWSWRNAGQGTGRGQEDRVRGDRQRALQGSEPRRLGGRGIEGSGQCWRGNWPSAGVGCGRAQQDSALAVPGQVPRAGRVRRPHWGCSTGKGGTRCPSAPSQGCSWHRSPLQADHEELFRDFLEGRSTPPSGAG